MKLRIISDGSILGTKIVDAESGEAIENIRAIRIEGDADYGWRATLETIRPKFDIIAETKEEPHE